jgi:hypothetical protein
MRLVLVFSISTVAYSGTNLLFVQQQQEQQQGFLPLLQPAQEQTAYAFHTEAHRNTTSHARQVVESVDQNLNATFVALLNANLTDAFFHLGIAQHDLSVLQQGNATIGLYTYFPRPPNVENPSLLGASPPAVTSSSPPAIISSSPPSLSSPTGPMVSGETGPITGEESTTGPQLTGPNQPFQTFQPSIPSQGSQGSLPSQSFQPGQPTQPTQPTQPSQPTQPTQPITPSQ